MISVKGKKTFFLFEFHTIFTMMKLVVLLIITCCGHVVADQAFLRFMVLADWGKGGTTGAYGNSLNSDANVVVLHNNLRTAADQSKDKDKKGGGSGGGSNGGSQKSTNQLAVAKAMDRFASSADPPPEFILSVGDNFYDNGVKSATDVMWDYLWKQVYLTSYPSLYIPWFATPGNHDYGGSVQAQIDRSNQHVDDDIWMMPSTNFSETFVMTSSDGQEEVRVSIVFVDTTTLSPSVNKCCNENG
jgi:hypothetical protein